LELWQKGSEVSFSSRPLDAWSANVPLVMPPRVHNAFDESIVMRTALKSLLPWLHGYVTDHFDISEYSIIRPRAINAPITSSFPIHVPKHSPRLCPNCVSPERICYDCQRPRDLNVIEWFQSSYFQAMWIPRGMLFHDLPHHSISTHIVQI
jgi:hypothetical protein